MTAAPSGLQAAPGVDGAVVATSTTDGPMVIGEFRSGEHDLVLERMGRPGQARLCHVTAAGVMNAIAELRYDPAIGSLTDHWRHPSAPSGLSSKTIAAWVAEVIPLLAAWCEQTGTPAYRSRQRDAIEDLVAFRLPVTDAAAALVGIEPAVVMRYQLTRLEICAALERYLSEKLSADDLQLWAATLYGRRDAGAELEHSEVIGIVLRALANPGWDPYLSLDRSRLLLEALGLVRPRWYARPSVLAGMGLLGYAAALPMLDDSVALPLWTGMVLVVVHTLRFGLDRARFGRAAAVAAARREALLSLPLCLAAMILGAAW